MPTQSIALGRALKLIRGSRYMVLATSSASAPWAATINYIVNAEGQLVYYSSPLAQHSRHIGTAGDVAAAIFSVSAGGDVDGLQLTGRCQMVTDALVLEDIHEQYYLRNFPDPNDRSEWLIERTQFGDGGTHRFYTIDIKACWIIDIDQWPVDKVDRRLAIPVEELIKQLKDD
jgi:uncharacterized protein YhbP (UPF0306 family)